MARASAWVRRRVFRVAVAAHGVRVKEDGGEVLGEVTARVWEVVCEAVSWGKGCWASGGTHSV